MYSNINKTVVHEIRQVFVGRSPGELNKTERHIIYLSDWQTFILGFSPSHLINKDNVTFCKHFDDSDILLKLY